jgi:outer membrane protein OmpA-like peptidoglycan-associated protein
MTGKNRDVGTLTAAAFVVLALLGGCRTPPDRIILLPDPEGKVGAVVVRSANAEQTVDKAYAGVDVASDGSMEKTMDSPSTVQTRYSQLLAARPPRPMTFTLFFLFDSATELAPESPATVEKMKAVLAHWPAPQGVVIGHTDLAGSQRFNDKLSLRRAEAVKAYLVSKGIEKNRVYTEGKGEKQPVADNKNADGRAKNRRVEIEVVGTRTVNGPAAQK